MNQLFKCAVSFAFAAVVAVSCGALFHCSGDTQIVLFAIVLFGAFNTREVN